MDHHGYSRRTFLQLASLGGGAVFASALPGVADRSNPAAERASISCSSPTFTGATTTPA